MTLEAFDPDRLDALSLRVLDLCSRLRVMARRSRDESLPEVKLHGRKPQEWLEKLEEWTFGAEAELDKQAKIAQAARHAIQAAKNI